VVPRFHPARVDHFFGRAKAEEVEATCWILSVRCHFAKTNNSPRARIWFERFINHCQRWGYAASRTRAENDLAFRLAKGTTR
jgi:hypothetical protein